MINAGSIMVCAMLVQHGKTIQDVMDFYQRATDAEEVVVDEELYSEEKETGYNNHALTSLMLANNAFPKYDTANETKLKAD